MKVPITLTVNGKRHRFKIEPRITLLELLRNTLQLTGTKEGCGMGECGSCIVLVDGSPVNSCLMLAVDAQGRRVTTIEGLASNDEVRFLLQSFVDKGAVQCGFCTPAMILSAKALLDKNPRPGEEEIKKALSGILCRCGSYKRIVQAIRAAAEKMGEESRDENQLRG